MKQKNARIVFNPHKQSIAHNTSQETIIGAFDGKAVENGKKRVVCEITRALGDCIARTARSFGHLRTLLAFIG